MLPNNDRFPETGGRPPAEAALDAEWNRNLDLARRRGGRLSEIYHAARDGAAAGLAREGYTGSAITDGSHGIAMAVLAEFSAQTAMNPMMLAMAGPPTGMGV